MFIWTRVLSSSELLWQREKKCTHTHTHTHFGRSHSNWMLSNGTKWNFQHVTTTKLKKDRCMDKSVSILLLIFKNTKCKSNLIRIIAFSCCVATFLARANTLSFSFDLLSHSSCHSTSVLVARVCLFAIFFCRCFVQSNLKSKWIYVYPWHIYK